MPQLPRTCHHQHHNLRDTVPHRLGIRRLAQIPKVWLHLKLILLLPSDILQLLGQVGEFGRELGDVRAVLLSVALSAADDYVEVKTYVRFRGPEVTGGGGEIDCVIARGVGGEGEAAVVWTAGFDDAVACGESL